MLRSLHSNQCQISELTLQHSSLPGENSSPNATPPPPWGGQPGSGKGRPAKSTDSGCSHPTCSPKLGRGTGEPRKKREGYRKGESLGQSALTRTPSTRAAGRLNCLPNKVLFVSQRGFSQNPPVQSVLPCLWLPGSCLVPYSPLKVHLQILSFLSLRNMSLGFQALERDFLLAEPPELFSSQTMRFLQAPRCAAPQTGLHASHPGIRANPGGWVVHPQRF